MKSKDIALTREEAREKLAQALRDENREDYAKAMDEMMQVVTEEMASDVDVKIKAMMSSNDTNVLRSRGAYVLTSEERGFYQKVADAMKSLNPKQSLEDINLVFPRTIVDKVFEDLEANHPLINAINFQNTTGLTEFITNEKGEQIATWGKLTDKIVKELLGGFEVKDVSLFKLSAFIPVCKSQLDLSPEWLDRFIRSMLYEAIANGLEYGIVAGDGKDAPIGMDKQVGDDVTVVGGVYPEKEAIKITDLSPATVGELISILAMHPKGKSRTVKDIIFITNPQDYWQKVMPATTVLAPDGTYRNNVMPYPMEIVQSHALPRNKAIIGLKNKYFAGVGMDKGGKIDYSDQYQFLEDNRVYLCKLYANGFPLDDNAFLVLDITDLRKLTFMFEAGTAPTPSRNADLNKLSLGSIKLTPAFSKDVTSYKATTKNSSNVINALTEELSAEAVIKVKGKTISNGTAIEWEDGENTVNINVTAPDGTANKTYTITVTKENE